MKPRIGVIPGDPSGIGPELIAKLIADPKTRARADVLLIGDRHLFERGQDQAGLEFGMTTVDARGGDWRTSADIALHDNETIEEAAVRVAEVSLDSGRSSIANLNLALELTSENVVDAFMFAPFNKAALHLAGLGHEDELQYVAARLGVRTYISELNTLSGIWTSRVTSHIALRDVADAISEDRISEAVKLIDGTLKRAGLKRPRIAVAALNPHAGDGGNFGREEIDIIKPAVDRLATHQMAVDGPWPSDTVFLKAKSGEIDAVVTMYHDQGQIALKLMGFDRGVTVLGGLPMPIATPAHGTAFDIAGKGVANPDAAKAAFAAVCDMVENWSAAA